LIVKRDEVNVEDCLINKFGVTFYQDYLRDYVHKFWKLPPILISKDFDLRIPSLSLKNIIHSVMSAYTIYRAKNNSSNNIIYPIYGIGQVIKPMINKMMNNSAEVKLGTIVKHVSISSGKLFVKLKDSSSTTEYSFNNVVWTGSLCDLVELLGLNNYRKKLNYRKLLIVNCAVEREDLLGEGIVDSYIVSPEIIFHRLYEPKKFSPKMAPASRSSVSIEITITGLIENVPYLIEKSIKQFQCLYNLASSEIKYLGFEIVEDAYPIIFTGYKEQVDEITNNLQKKNIYLIGRTGHYEYIGIQKVLEEALQISSTLCK
jgi:protoporphyrinogen oxidase